MDCLPEELITNIFSFFSGKDVARFQQLNKWIRKIIKDNRRSLDFPKFTLKISDVNELNIKNVEFAINDGPKCFLDCSNVNSVKGKMLISFGRLFVEPFFIFEENYFPKGKISLRSILDIIFEKGDVELLLQIRNMEFIRIVNEAVKNNSNFIYSLEVLAKNQDDPRIIDLLHNVGSQKLKAEGFPRIRVLLDGIGPTWMGFRKINEIASKTCNLTFFVPEQIAVDFMNTVVLEWKKNNFPEIFFSFSSQDNGREVHLLQLEAFSALGAEFEVSLEHKAIHTKILMYERTCLILLKHKKSGNVIQFYQEHEQRNNWYNRLQVKITISVN